MAPQAGRFQSLRKENERSYPARPWKLVMQQEVATFLVSKNTKYHAVALEEGIDPRDLSPPLMPSIDGGNPW